MSIYFQVLFMKNTSVERPFVLVCRREKELVLKLHIHIKMAFIFAKGLGIPTCQPPCRLQDSGRRYRSSLI